MVSLMVLEIEHLFHHLKGLPIPSRSYSCKLEDMGSS